MLSFQSVVTDTDSLVSEIHSIGRLALESRRATVDNDNDTKNQGLHDVSQVSTTPFPYMLQCYALHTVGKIS
ncbi:hypothetical protein [Oscillatoria sp. FACHB-1406]|uniref:hypothetical protein n=1 Tax=Oscillatoria sp. FACHB-1406 TaxID=2692846 RepID=UPI0016869E70|nr:hypothetical protein [Oscillatoria sp. FACHB-1406]MBD2577917.1 hypothetical protein [Oscillatoria sp. FACHB-1406]